MENDISAQLRAIHLRLDRLEDAVLNLSGRRSSAAPTGTNQVPGTPAPKPPYAPTQPGKPHDMREAYDSFFDTDTSTSPEPSDQRRDLTITQVMGWTGVTLLVLAAAYLIRMVYDSGWLTPQRQIFMAVVSAFLMIGAGLQLRRTDQNYASLLPAGGLVVLFLSTYGAHLYYHFISAHLAMAAVICIGLLSLWLGALFASEVFGLFAVVGSYSAPLLLPAMSGSVADVAIYFTAWSTLFCTYALLVRNRRPYLLANYCALVAFQMTWDGLPGGNWLGALGFQAAQFALFLLTAIGFSVRSARPMTPLEANTHLPLLLIFYALQYQLLHTHAPQLAPWIAIGSAAVLLLAYLAAEHLLQMSLRASGYIVGAYCALVLFHAGYIELLSDDAKMWVLLLAIPCIAMYSLSARAPAPVALPVQLLVTGVFIANFLRLLLAPGEVWSGNATPLTLLYVAELYAAYFVGRIRLAQAPWPRIALYGAHIGLMHIALDGLSNALTVSLAWAALALVTLILAYLVSDKVLGQSSLAIFFASIVKVLLFDLSGTAPWVRIGSLVVAGLSLFIGGLLYKSVMALESKPTAEDVPRARRSQPAA